MGPCLVAGIVWGCLSACVSSTFACTRRDAPPRQCRRWVTTGESWHRWADVCWGSDMMLEGLTCNLSTSAASTHCSHLPHKIMVPFTLDTSSVRSVCGHRCSPATRCRGLRRSCHSSRTIRRRVRPNSRRRFRPWCTHCTPDGACAHPECVVIFIILYARARARVRTRSC
jgi:hypothetical protein